METANFFQPTARFFSKYNLDNFRFCPLAARRAFAEKNARSLNKFPQMGKEPYICKRNRKIKKNEKESVYRDAPGINGSNDMLHY